MNAQGQLRETFTRGVGLVGDIGTLIAVTHHAGSWTNGTFYTHHNHRGDVVLTRSGTTTVGTYLYSAFGNLSSVLGPDVCRFKFSSKERDPATGFYYSGYRFHAPQWQRWVNPDLIGEIGRLNLYEYARNNPGSVLDVLGLDSETDLLAVCLAGCDRVYTLVGSRKLGKIAEKRVLDLGIGLIPVAVCEAVVNSLFLKFSSLVEPRVFPLLEYDYFAVGRIFAYWKGYELETRRQYLRCLNDCRYRCPGNDERVLTHYRKRFQKEEAQK